MTINDTRVRAKFTFEINHQKNRVEIIDVGGRNDMSVTNDIESVLMSIHRGYHKIDHLKVIYRDSEGNWDTVIPYWWNDLVREVKFKPGIDD